MTTIQIKLFDEELLATAHKTLFWESARTLFVADLHLGKAAAFRARSIPLPHGTTEVCLSRLDAEIERYKPSRIAILGDLWHDRLGRTDDLLQRFARWRGNHSKIEFILISGNHDIRAGITPDWVGLDEMESYCLGPFCCLHHPVSVEDKYVLAGHIHPGFRFGSLRNSVKLPCFLLKEKIGILPAFGEFTGMAEVHSGPHDQILGIADEQIFDLSPFSSPISCP